MYRCMIYLDVEDLLKLQGVSRTFWVVTQEKCLWNFLCKPLRQKAPQTPLKMHDLTSLSDRDFCCVERRRWRHHQTWIENNATEQSRSRNSWLCMYIHVSSAESPKPYFCFLATCMCVFSVVAVITLLLFALDLDDKSSDKMLLPSLTTLLVDCLVFVCIFFACVVVLTCVTWDLSRDLYSLFPLGSVGSAIGSRSLDEVCMNSNELSPHKNN